MDSKSQVFKNSPQVSRLRGRPKFVWRNCVHTDISTWKLQIGKSGQKTDLTGRRLLRRRRSAMDCRAIEEEVVVVVVVVVVEEEKEVKSM
jgi:hypothetical protein